MLNFVNRISNSVLGRRLLLIFLFFILLSTAPSGGLETTGPSQEITPPDSIAPVQILPAAQDREVVGAFGKNQNITAALTQYGISKEMVMDLVQTTKPVYNLARVIAGSRFWLKFSPDGEFTLFNYIVDDETYLTVYRKDERFIPVLKKFRFETRIVPISGKIEDNLFNAVADAGEEIALVVELAGLFQWDIDFNTDIQKGDAFRFLVEKRYLDGNFHSYARRPILAADLIAEKKLLSGFRFHDEKGAPAYFSPEGKSLKKSFLKSPLAFIRVTSRFSRSRFHPVLKRYRPHLGIDYAAASGTPVRAVAAGKVMMAGWSGGGGNTIKLIHGGGYETTYMHLSRISVRYGAHVAQGQVIGKVGSTGIATGPHLDFRIYQRGRPMNPARFIAPPAPPIPQSSMKSFLLVRDDLRSRLDQVSLN